jgi:hypothetical protein
MLFYFYYVHYNNKTYNIIHSYTVHIHNNKTISYCSHKTTTPFALWIRFDKVKRIYLGL